MNGKRNMIIVCAAFALAACGGGGGSSEDEVLQQGTVAQGVYKGAITGGAYPAFQMLVLENGEFWAMYGTQSASTFGVAGFVQGTGVSSGGAFTSTNMKDFGYAPAVGGNLNAAYNASAGTISGTLTALGNTVSFSGAPNSGSLYNYDAAASLGTLSGNWTLTSLMSGETISLSVGPSGALTAHSSLGCSMSGSAAPRPSGKNVFNISLTFGASPCRLAGQTATGIALAYPLANGQTQFLFAGFDSSRAYGVAAVGAR